MRKPPVFSNDWFSHSTPILAEVLDKFKGVPSVKALEIGCYEGMGTLWFLDNILTGPGTSIDCVDTFKGSQEHGPLGVCFDGVHARFRNNTNKHPRAHDVKLYVSASYSFLKSCTTNYDFVIVDGSHMAVDVLSDLVLSWPLILIGGVMFCDDYGWPGTDNNPYHRPKLAIDAFLSVHWDLKLLHKDYSVAVEKSVLAPYP